MKNKYYATNFFMSRTPLFPINFYENLFDENLTKDEQVSRIKETLKDRKVLEVLTNSSDSLGHSIERINNGEILIKEEKIISSALKYMIRMSTRTTPYGMLAGVNNGIFSDYTKVEIADIKECRKRCRPDMEWLLGVVDIIEKDKDLVKDVRIRFNGLNYLKGKRLNNPFICNCGQGKDGLDEEKKISASIRYTSQVEYVKNISADFIKFDSVAKSLIERNPDVNQDKIYDFLYNLLNNEYLISELRPPLMNSDPLSYLISKMSKSKKLDSYYKSLCNIKILIDRYNDLEIGMGIDIYKKTLSYMKKLNKSNIYLQTDLRIKNNSNELNKDIAIELEDTIEALSKITSENGESAYLKAYKVEFMEKYGTYVEVPVLKVIDADIGLGLPSSYQSINKYRSLKDENIDLKTDRFKRKIFSKMIECENNYQDEIVITDEDIEEICDGIEDNEDINLEQSLELNVFITAEDEDKLDKNDFRVHIGPNYGSYGAGKIFGRFMDILDSELQSEFKHEYQINKEYFGDEYMIVEIAELTRYGRNSNISLNINPIENELAISTNYSGEKEKIDIRDLVVGIDSENNNSFYIRYIKNNKKVIFSTNNMLNNRLYSNITRYLIEISNSNYTSILDTIALIGSTEYKYRPRIRYNKTILCPAIWNISNNTIKEKYINFEEFCNVFYSYKNEIKIPNYVYLKKSDNRLLLNLNNKFHLMEIYKELKKNNKANLELSEIEFSFDEIIMKDANKDKYISEIVIPFRLNSNANRDKAVDRMQIKGLETKSQYKYNKNNLEIDDKKRMLLPGDNGWFYIKLYGNSERVTDVIGFDIYDFCEEIKSDGIIEKYFFIRYADPSDHIRLRIKASTNCGLNVFSKINSWIGELKEEGVLSRVVFDTYIREAERYGGIEAIDYIEELFYKDSVCVAKLLKLKKLGNLKVNDDYIGIIGILFMLEDFGLAYETQKDLFDKLINRNDLREYFNRDRRNLIKISNSNNKWKNLVNFDYGNILYGIFKERSESITKFKKRIDELDLEGKLTNSKENILLSIIHMFCNRYMADNNWERKILTLIRHSLQSLEYQKKNNL